MKNYIHLTVSGLGSMTGTTGHAFPLIVHPISSKSDGYGPTFKGFLVLRFFPQKTYLRLKRKSAIPIYYLPIY
jgi:hypothetical protein